MSDLLQEQLHALAERIDVGDTSRLVDGVLSAIAAGDGSGRGGDAAPSRHDRRLIPARVWLSAAAIVLVLCLLAIPGPRHAIAHWFGIGSTRIERSPSVPSTTTALSAVPVPTEASTVTFPTSLGLGRSTTAEAAASAADLPVPLATELGQPAGIFTPRQPIDRQIVVVYQPSESLPASPIPGVGALLSSVPARLDEGSFLKMAGTGTTVEPLTLDGDDGRTIDAVWLEGSPHEVMYVGDGDEVFWETLRLATNTLLWEDSGVVYRLEAQLDRDRAVAIAQSIIEAR